MPKPPSPWKAKVLLRAHARAVAVRDRQGYADMGRIQLNVGDPVLPMLSAAAERRGMKVSAYCRRAVAAFIAADLGVPMAQITQHMAHPLGPHAGAGDPGTGYGEWTATPFTDDTGVIQGS